VRELKAQPSKEEIKRLTMLQRRATRVNGATPADHPDRKASVELTQLIDQLVSRKVSMGQIARILGVTRGAVASRLMRHGFRKAYPSITDVYKGQPVGGIVRNRTPSGARDLYQRGRTMRDIAATFQTSEKTIRRWLRGQGVESRATGPIVRQDVSDEVIRQLIEVYRWSYAQVAEHVGMSKTGVRMRYYRIIGRPRPDRA
jgi:transposase-like protein